MTEGAEDVFPELKGDEINLHADPRSQQHADQGHLLENKARAMIASIYPMPMNFRSIPKISPFR